VTTTLRPRRLRLIDPAPNAVVLPAHRVRPGTPASALPRLRDNIWQLSYLDHLDTASSLTFSWWDVPGALRASLKRLAYAVLNLPAPAVLLERKATSTRPTLSASSVLKMLRAWRDFARWLDERQVHQLQDVDRTLLEEYGQLVTTQARAVRQNRRELYELTRAWAYAPFLLPCDQLVMPPWEDEGSAISDFFNTEDLDDGECESAVIHPATMSPLLVWALRLVTDLAPDILAAYQEWRRLDANTAAATTPEGYDRLRDYVGQLRDSGRSFPTFAGRQRAAIQRRYGRPPLARRYVAGVLGISLRTIDNLMHREPDLLHGLDFGDGAPLGVPVTARISGRPWTAAIDHADAVGLAVHLATAAMITTAYLSGMRPAEVLHLRRGCARREERADGTIRHTLTGRHFKNVLGPDGRPAPTGVVRPDPWVVTELVARAVAVLEELSDDDLLLPRSLSANARDRDADHRGPAITPEVANHRIQLFTVWANQTAARLGRPHETIPPDLAGPVTMRRFRRTVAWFIYRQPGGRIALGLQYGHVGRTLAAASGGRTQQDMLEVLDFERQLALADTLTEASDRLTTGEGVSGPAADRYVAAAHEFGARYTGGFATRAQLRALMNNPRLQVYEDPDALLTCNHDPYKALCDPDHGHGTPRRTPSFDRCHTACGNISRTDTHIERARQEAERLRGEIADGLNPAPLAKRLSQRVETLEGIIHQHQTTRRIPRQAQP
jgi:integrase